MANNASLHAAGVAKQDEFYTQYEDIQNELNHYEKHFKGKIVLCNCDDPFESNFCKFFLRNFNYLGLKRLICTSYGESPVMGQQMTLFDDEEKELARGNGYVMDISEVPMANGRGVSDADIDALLKSKKRGVKRLKGDGDFRSEECVEYLKQADIVVTNPPFSLFREYVAQLMEYEKYFLIIGNQNAITYKEIFPLIQQNKLWLGHGFHAGNAYFSIPKENIKAYASGVYNPETGLVKFRNCRWFTNMDHDKRHEEIVLYKHYYGNEESYPRYDNYDAINVDKVADIPCDYFEKTGENMQKSLTEAMVTGDNSHDTTRHDTTRHDTTRHDTTRHDTSALRCSGVMGVPITFLDKYNPDQFEIIGLDRYVHDNPRYGHRFTVSGRETYARVLIRRKMQWSDGRANNIS